jgi:hypothetical protein
MEGLNKALPNLLNTDQYRAMFSGMSADAVLPQPATTPEEYVRRMDAYREAFAEDAVRRRVCDVNESLIFAQALEHWIAETLDQPYPRYFADELIPMRRNIPPGAGTVVAYGYDKTGEATVLSGLGEDIPRVDLSARRMTSPMVGLAAAFAVSQQQIREAAMAPNNPQIESMGLDAVRLRDGALSGSGFEVKGAHVVDVRKGVAATRYAAAWSVAPSGALSDALSTAFLGLSWREIEEACAAIPGSGALVAREQPAWMDKVRSPVRTCGAFPLRR